MRSSPCNSIFESAGMNHPGSCIRQEFVRLYQASSQEELKLVLSDIVKTHFSAEGFVLWHFEDDQVVSIISNLACSPRWT